MNRENGTSGLPMPPGLSVTRDATGYITQIVRGSTNEGELVREGLDVSAVFQHKYAALGSFSHNLKYSQLLKASTNGVRFEGEFGAPKDRWTLTNNWKMGPVAATWIINSIGKNGDEGVGYVKAYITHDLQVSWDTPLKGVKLTAGALNLDAKLPEKVSNDTRQFNFSLYDQYGRQVYGRVEVKF